jgi:hypothetical protein
MRLRNVFGVFFVSLALAACGGGGGGGKGGSLAERVCSRSDACDLLEDGGVGDCREAVDAALASATSAMRDEEARRAESCLSRSSCDAYEPCIGDVEDYLTGGAGDDGFGDGTGTGTGGGTGTGSGGGTGTGSGTGGGTSVRVQLPAICGQWAGEPCIEYGGSATAEESQQLVALCSTPLTPGTCTGNLGNGWHGYCLITGTSALTAKVYLPLSQPLGSAPSDCAADGGTWMR